MVKYQSILRFLQAVDSLDSGFYMCIAENRFGQDDAEGRLVVRGE